MTEEYIIPIAIRVAESSSEYALTVEEHTELHSCSVSEKIIRSLYPDYDGPTEVSPDHAEHTLPTADKVVHDNIVVQALPETTVDVSDTTAAADKVKRGEIFHLASGEAAAGTLDWSMIGDEPEFVSRVYDSGEIALKSTSFNGWTPSTTAKTIKASVSAGTFAADMANYEYLLRWRCEFNAVYAEGTVKKAAVEREVAELWQALCRRSASLSAIAAENSDGNSCITYMSIPLNVYYNTDGARKYTYSTSYGVYPAVTAATFSSSSSDAPTVTVKTPSYSARCSATYFSTAMAAALDQDKSKFRIVGELYRIKPKCAMRQAYERMIDLYNNGIPNS